MNPFRFRQSSRSGAFTLVELLVVITIIGMLMALILPAVHSAVGRANQTHRSNNMRQVAVALNTRTVFNGRFPGYQQELAGRVVPWPVVILGEVERYDLLRDWHPTTSPPTEHHINRGIDLPPSQHTARPSSRHIGGVNVSFCDTHTRYLKEAIDYKVYMQLMTTDGKNSDMPAEWKGYQLNSADYD